MEKTILLASFINQAKIDWFIGYLDKKFKITKEKVFCYKNLDDDEKSIVTFKLTIPNGEFIDLRKIFPSALTIHKRGNALYTLNALNKVIEQQVGDSIGNIDYRSISINWDEYQNKMILINNGELSILNIERVF